MSSNASVVMDLDRQRMAAMGNKDTATLEKLIADDLIYVHSTARQDTKATLIGAMTAGTTVYASVEPSNVVAQDLGSAVVVTGEASIKVTSNGNPMAFRVRFADVWANRNGNWQMVTWQSTKLR